MEILLPSASLYSIRTCACTYGMVDGKISLFVPHVCVFVFPFSRFSIFCVEMYINSSLMH
jgi:hypothetical protein